MSVIQKISIFYFSGTGNSKRIALWLSEFAVEKRILCNRIDLSCINIGFLQNVDPQSLIVFISPIHGFNYPKITLDFIRTFPYGENHVVLMNTRAAVKIGNRIIPGVTGIAFILSSLLLKRKGYRIVGQIPFDMPSNWISVHPAIRVRTANFIFEKSYYRVKKHFEKLSSGKRDYASRKDIVQDIIISPISLVYYLLGRFFLAKSYYASWKCLNCNLCMKSCPVKAIKKVYGRPYWTFKCENCMKCMNRCPVNAIEAPHALWIIAVYITSVISSYFCYQLLPDSIQFWATKFILFNILLLVFIWVLYLIQQIGLANRIITKIISFTSLTYYRFWGRYTSNRHFHNP